MVVAARYPLLFGRYRDSIKLAPVRRRARHGMHVSWEIPQRASMNASAPEIEWLKMMTAHQSSTCVFRDATSELSYFESGVRRGNELPRRVTQRLTLVGSCSYV